MEGAADGEGGGTAGVVNPDQADALDAVRRQKPSGPSLVAFFGSMYFAALRPAEASDPAEVELALPARAGASCC